MIKLKDLLKENSSMIYPINNNASVESLLSGRSVGSWRAKKMVSGLQDVFGNDVSIISNDEVIHYLQVNSTDDSSIYVVVRKNLQQTRRFYIPSKYKQIDQTDQIESTR